MRQVLSPSKQGFCGTKLLNPKLQNVFNPRAVGKAELVPYRPWGKHKAGNDDVEEGVWRTGAVSSRLRTTMMLTSSMV